MNVSFLAPIISASPKDAKQPEIIQTLLIKEYSIVFKYMKEKSLIPYEYTEENLKLVFETKPVSSQIIFL